MQAASSDVRQTKKRSNVVYEFFKEVQPPQDATEARKNTHRFYECRGCSKVVSIATKYSSPTNLMAHITRCSNREHMAAYEARVADSKRKTAAANLTVEDIEVILPKQKQAKLATFL